MVVVKWFKYIIKGDRGIKNWSDVIKILYGNIGCGSYYFEYGNKYVEYGNE